MISPLKIGKTELFRLNWLFNQSSKLFNCGPWYDPIVTNTQSSFGDNDDRSCEPINRDDKYLLILTQSIQWTFNDTVPKLLTTHNGNILPWNDEKWVPTSFNTLNTCSHDWHDWSTADSTLIWYGRHPKPALGSCCEKNVPNNNNNIIR